MSQNSQLGGALHFNRSAQTLLLQLHGARPKTRGKLCKLRTRRRESKGIIKIVAGAVHAEDKGGVLGEVE